MDEERNHAAVIVTPPGSQPSMSVDFSMVATANKKDKQSENQSGKLF
jgi:hypothetical protein